MLQKRGEDDPYLALHNRLDLGTSGVLILARQRSANKGLSDAFQGGQVTKIYRALVMVDGSQRPPVDEQWSVDNHLGAVAEGPRGKQGSVRAGGDWAKTSFKVVERKGLLWEVEAMPVSGRRHQIRVHLAERGLPIVGDELYGGDGTELADKAGRMMLHAHKVVIPHPLREDYLDLEAPLPPAFMRVMEAKGRD